MEDLKLLFADEDRACCIVKVSEKKYYYGEGGETYGGFGIAPEQFLRFNPYLDYVGDRDLPVPDVVRKWIMEHLDEA